VTWSVTVKGSCADATDPPATATPIANAATSFRIAAPSVASAHRSLPEKAGTDGGNCHRPKNGRV
jgi:hypothetical protein